jgi:anti-sigma regulatory factor (Ser/Thr protein kinase)
MRLDGVEDIAGARRLVARVAAGVGMHSDQVDRLTVALSEAATNAVVHGGGTGTILITGGPGELAVEVRDRGAGLPTRLGAAAVPPTQLPVPPTHLSGRGLWLAGQLCDDIDIRASDAGTRVRLTMRLSAARVAVDGPARPAPRSLDQST